jgi:hypothetical protein
MDAALIVAVFLGSSALAVMGARGALMLVFHAMTHPTSLQMMGDKSSS